MIIESIDENSPYLKKVKDLGRKNSKTLGFFPAGAFDEHAVRRCILIAKDDAEEFMGYLLYRVVRRGGTLPSAVIVHLCIDDMHRGKGVGKELINELCRKTKAGFLRLELNCRRDYEANKFWPQVGFIARGESTGRSGQPLVRWERVFRQLPLLALLEDNSPQKRFNAVIDANIFYRLQDPLPAGNKSDINLSEEAKALQSDWLSDDVALMITKETFNEIHRNGNTEERKRRLIFAEKFDSFDIDFDQITALEKRLSIHFPKNPKDNSKSDLKQLAYAIASNADFFITQDTGVLKRSDVLDNEFDIKVLSPGEFIGRIDEIFREVEYQPSRIAGSLSIQNARLRSKDIAELYTYFRDATSEEKKSQFESNVRNFMSQPNRYDVELSTRSDSRPLALIVYERTTPSELVIPLIRIAHSSLSGTIIRYLLRRALLTASDEQRPFIRVTNVDGQRDTEGALKENGFSLVNGYWVKCSLQIADESAAVLDKIKKLRGQFPSAEVVLDNVIDALVVASKNQDVLIFSDIEQRIWPAKILDANIPTYIVPIHPLWAQHLFDEDIANQTLWGSNEDLALANENVYYRNKRTVWKITAPARILWYVTKDNKYQNSMQIRACSSLNEVVVGRAKDLYKRFQRLGVYEWKNVLQTAKGEAKNEIMAFSFSNTEILLHPITLGNLRAIMLDTEAKEPVLQSPQQILPSTFARIYREAMQDNGGADND
jgi:predicted nucleic acid-binding protein/GNAT superfamily N-acetyltransferase